MAMKAKDSRVKSNPRWKSISDAVTRLFELKRYPELAQNLPVLNENVSALAKSDLGPFISDYYQDNILTPCMDKLLLELAQERDADLIDKMVDVWIQFYTSILPTLSAIFASLQPQQNKLSVRSVTLINFRDLVVLKTKLAAAVLHCKGPFPPQIQQMLLVLQSVHRTPPDDRFFILQDIVGAVVESYLPMVTGAPLRSSPGVESRNIRATTMDVLDSGSHPSDTQRMSHSPERGLSPGERRHSMDTESPVTRL